MIGRRGLVGAALAALAGRKKKPVSGSWSNTGQNLIILQEQTSGFSGLFGYSPAPGHGNLVFSLAAKGGQDPYLNTYVAGLATYDESANDLFTQVAAGLIRIGEIIPGGGPDLPDAGLIQAGLTGITDSLTIRGIVDPIAHTDAAQITLVAGNPLATTGQPGVPNVQLFDTAGSSPVDLWLTGTAVKLQGADSPYTWQTPAFAAGYTVSGLAQYRLDALDNVVWDLSVTQTTGSGGAGAAVIISAAVPAAYRPKTHNRPIPCAWTSSAQVSKGAATMRFNTDGTVSLMWPAATANGDIFSATVSIPLNNIG